MNGRRHSVLWSIPAATALCVSLGARADNFGTVRYDKQAGRLVVTILYRGTTPNHQFSLKWGECQANQSGNLHGATAEVLDDQYNDAAEQEFQKTQRFTLAELPCSRPAVFTLKTAPRFLYTLTIPR